MRTTEESTQVRADKALLRRAKSKSATEGRSLKSVVDELLTGYTAPDSSFWTREQCATEIEAMCHWTQLKTPQGSKEVAAHRAFHFGYTCPYEAMAAVLRGQPDPRSADYQVETS